MIRSHVVDTSEAFGLAENFTKFFVARGEMPKTNQRLKSAERQGQPCEPRCRVTALARNATLCGDAGPLTRKAEISAGFHTKDAKHAKSPNSSFVASWRSTPGTSSMHPIHQSPSFFVIAVNVEPMPISYPKRHRQQGDILCVILTADCTDLTDIPEAEPPSSSKLTVKQQMQRCFYENDCRTAGRTLPPSKGSCISTRLFS